MYNLKITVKRIEYPYFETMGAYLAFKEMTGVEPSESIDVESNLKYMYCVTKAACRHDDVEFKLSFDEFGEGLLLGEYLRINNEVADSLKNDTEPKK